jgi:hypothetical protein
MIYRTRYSGVFWDIWILDIKAAFPLIEKLNENRERPISRDFPVCDLQDGRIEALSPQFSEDGCI